MTLVNLSGGKRLYYSLDYCRYNLVFTWASLYIVLCALDVGIICKFIYFIILQTDYVKWRGVLFLRFLLSLDDESETIRQLADFLFGNILKGNLSLFWLFHKRSH